MSLIKQLWLAIALVVTFCLSGSYFLSTLSATRYLEAQLYQKNVDSANNIALILGSRDYDPVIAELQIASQFDSGFFQWICLSDGNGNVLIEKSDHSEASGVPNWFVQLVRIEPAAGEAQVSNGWRQIGKLSVMSNKHFAYRELWLNSIALALYFLTIGVMAGLVGHYLLLRLTKPLQDVVQQALAIGERRFVTVAEPKTREFRQVVSSMNALSKRVQSMLAEEVERLQSRHMEQTTDGSTGLLRREPFIAQVSAHTQRDDNYAAGAMLLLRIVDLQDLNRLHNRSLLDNFIRALGDKLREFAKHGDFIAGRLDGADFAVLMPGHEAQASDLEQLFERLNSLAQEQGLGSDVIAASQCGYSPREEFDTLYARLESGLDQHLSASEHKLVRVASNTENLPADLKAWRTLFSQAFAQGQFQLTFFPVIGRDGSLLHLEAPMRLPFGDKLLSAGQFLGWAKRANCITQVDESGLQLAFESIADQGQDIGINASPHLLTDPEAQNRFVLALSQQREHAKRLWLEFPESGVYHYLGAFKQFATRLKQHGCHLGIEHAGHAIEHLGMLHDVGLDYIKIDSAFIRGIDGNHANQIFLQGLITIAHSIGLKIIAEGVNSKSEVQCLWNLGFDGMTGPGVEKSPQSTVDGQQS